MVDSKSINSDYWIKKEVSNIGKFIIITLNGSEEQLIEHIESLLVEQNKFVRSEYQSTPVLSFPPLEINLSQYRVYIFEKEIALTRIEYEILVQLASRPGMVFTYEQLYSIIWNNDATGNENKVLSYHIRRLRQKLSNANKSIRIFTVREVGYRFDTIA